MRRAFVTTLVGFIVCGLSFACHRNFLPTSPVPLAGEFPSVPVTDTAAPGADPSSATVQPDASVSESGQPTPTAAVEENTPQPSATAVPVPAGPTSTPAPSPSPFASAMPLPTPPDTLVDSYVIRSGDTLGGISLAFDVPLAELLALNGLASEEAMIKAGQVLQIPLTVSRSAPEVVVLPDSEVVYSPAYVGFDVNAFVERQGGYLVDFSAVVDGVSLTGAEIVSRVARQDSVGPRVLLALLEHYGGWVTRREPNTYQPLGPGNPYYDESFKLQLQWAANQVAGGYYGYKRNGTVVVRFLDESRAQVPEGVNAGTAGILNILALNGDWETWTGERQAFLETYRRLFGDPFAWAVEPLVPAILTQPPLRLPWETGEVFYFVGGPHAAFSSRNAWAAIDLSPSDTHSSCFHSSINTVAAADGRVLLGETGEIYVDLDGDGNLETGWVLLYFHTVARDDITDGQLVTVGTPLGHASCEGGYSSASHLHFARRYNGEWIAADGPVPMVLSGWTLKGDVAQYDGTMVRDGVTKTACECTDEVINAIVGE